MAQRNDSRRVSLPVWKLKKWLPAVLAAAAGVGGPVTWAFAQTTPPAATQPEKKDAPPAPAAAEKTVSINFDLAPWNDVLEWFSKESGLQIISAVRPTGSVTLKPGKDKKYTMGEAVDLLNELLMQQKFLLIRRDQSFFIWPTDEPVEPFLVPRLTPDQLPKRGKTELVQVLLPLDGSMPVAEHADEIKKMLGPTGRMVSLEKPNSILILDTAGNILRVMKIIDEINKRGDTDTLTHVCKYRKARELAETLKTLLKDSTTDVTTAASSGPSGQPFDFGGRGFGMGGRDFGGGRGMDFGGGRGMDFGGGGGTRGDSRGMSSAANARTKSVQITVENRSNTLLIVAPPDKISQAKKIIADIDKGKPGEEIKPAPPEVRTYTVGQGTSEIVARTLQEQYPANRITAVPGTNQIVVYGTPDEQEAIRKEINPPSTETNTGMVSKVIPLNVIDPAGTAATLTKSFPASTSGGPIIEVNTGLQSGIFFRGSADQLKEAEKIIEALGEKPGTGGGFGGTPNMRVIPLDNGSAATLAEVLKNTMQGMGKNPVIIQNLNNPSVAPAANPPAVRPTPAPAPGVVPPPMKVPTMPQSRGTGPDIQFVMAQVPEAQKNDAKPVTITVTGNRLVITSDDPAALELMSQIARLYTTGGNKPDDNLFEVLRLRMVSAEDAAKEITEIFNGPQQPQQGGAGGGRGGPGGGIGALFGGGGIGSLLGLGGGAAAPAPGRVRVVAEKSSNSLIVVKASPLDLATIKRLLRDAIDGGPNDDVVTMRTFIIELKNAEASAMATTVKDVYKTYLGTTGGGGGGPINPFAAFAPQPQGGAQKPPALTVGTDDRTNSLVLQCSETLYTEIKFLADQLEAKTTNTNEVVRVVPLKGVDPSLVLAAIDAIQGRDPKLRQQQGQRGFGGMGGQGLGGGGLGGGGFPGMGGGGFPGMGGGGQRGTGGGGFPGMGGGNFGGGGARGGGATGGGGGNRGGGGGGKGGRVAMLGGSEGPLNFDYRGTDAPSAVSTIYDPAEAPPVSLNILVYPGRTGVQQVSAQVPGAQPPGGALPPMTQPTPPPGAPGQGFSQPSPRAAVTAYTLDEAGLLFLRTADADDMKIILDIIAFVQAQGKALQPKLEIYYCKNQDCNSLSSTLNSVFARVLVGAGGNSIPAAARNPQSGILGAVTGAPSATQNVYCVSLPRFNAILIAGPEGRFEDIKKEVERLDIPNTVGELTKQFQLVNQPAQIIATQLQQWWNQRFPGEPTSTNQFRVQYDLKSNSVIVQGSPTDLKDAEALIKMLDSSTSKAVNEVRIFKLKNAFADELGQTIVDSLSSNLVNPIAQQQQTGTVSTTAGGGIQAALGQVQGGQALGQQGAFGAQGLNQLFQQGGFGAVGAQQRPGGTLPLTAVIPTLGQSAAGGMATKVNSIRFYSNDGKIYESGHLADVHVITNTRTNALVVAAPPDTMKLIEKLIDNLDTVSAGQSFINIYTLKKADALLTATLITQAFTGQGRTATTGQQQGGAFGQQGAQGAQGANAGLAGQTTTRPLITISGDVSSGATLVDLRITVDDRTNSLVVAGSQNDLETVLSLIAKLEAVDTPTRVRDVIKLRHQAAADVQTALNTFITASLQVFSGAQFLTAYQNLQRAVTLTPESVSNSILIEATPVYMAEVRRLIAILDVPPPQVMIQVTIAEVQLSNTQEAGVEVGLQSRVLFNRGVTAVAGTTGLPGGAATPGFNFNTTAALPNGVVDQGIVGFQGLGNLGVGRSSPSANVGGFVFSAAGESFNVLARALQAQGRIEVLSRPSVQVADNQTGYVQVGQDFPYVTVSNATLGVAQQSVEYRSIGVTMRVTPRVSADGRILMRVEPQVSSVSPTLVPLGNGTSSPAFNVQTVQTTVLAADGETVVLGGLISKSDSRSENGIPFFKNIPYIGALFRYRSQVVGKRELIIIMTPKIMRGELDQATVLSEEVRRMNWCVPDVAKIHGHGMDVIGPAMKGANPVPVPTYPSAGPAYFGPLGGDANPGMLVVPQAAAPYTTLPPGMVAQPPMSLPAAPTPMPSGAPMTSPVIPPAGGGAAIPPIPAPGGGGTPIMSAPPANHGVTPVGYGPVAPPMPAAPVAPVAGGPMAPVAPAGWTPPPQPAAVAGPRRGFSMSPVPEAQGAPPANTKPTEGNQWQPGR